MLLFSTWLPFFSILVFSCAYFVDFDLLNYSSINSEFNFTLFLD
jgi:hypothetical protein